MTSSVSIRVNDKLLRAMKANAARLALSQTDYIRKAIEHMNRETERHEREAQLKHASLRVRQDSMAINAVFSEIEHDPDA